MTETRVEYAVLYEWPSTRERRAVPSLETGRHYVEYANRSPRDVHASVVRRTVTYGEWEPVSD